MQNCIQTLLILILSLLLFSSLTDAAGRKFQLRVGDGAPSDLKGRLVGIHGDYINTSGRGRALIAQFENGDSGTVFVLNAGDQKLVTIPSHSALMPAQKVTVGRGLGGKEKWSVGDFGEKKFCSIADGLYYGGSCQMSGEEGTPMFSLTVVFVKG